MVELDFKKYTRDGFNQAIKECESYIGMTLAEAVEKQIPKAPVVDHIYAGGINAIDFKIFACPLCGEQVDQMYYCPSCGQKIDWEAVDNGL